MAAIVVALPFQIVCQLVVTGPPGVTQNITPVNPPPLAPAINPSPQHSQTVILPNGYIAYPDIGVAYKIYNESVLWKVGRRRCMSEGGHLALIDSVKKFEYMMSQRKSEGVTHVGIHSLFDDDEWVSVKTGFPVTTIPWAPGEPNGRSHCAMVKHKTGGLGNFNCDTALGDFVCEIPIPDNDEVGERPLGRLAVN